MKFRKKHRAPAAFAGKRRSGGLKSTGRSRKGFFRRLVLEASRKHNVVGACGSKTRKDAAVALWKRNFPQSRLSGPFPSHLPFLISPRVLAGKKSPIQGHSTRGKRKHRNFFFFQPSKSETKGLIPRHHFTSHSHFLFIYSQLPFFFILGASPLPWAIIDDRKRDARPQVNHR